MTPEEFIALFQTTVREQCVSATSAMATSPTGRAPSPKLTRLSNWYAQADEASQAAMIEIVGLSVDVTISGLLSILDEIRPVEPRNSRGHFELIHIDKDGVRTLLNDRASGVYLNEKYRIDLE